MDSYFPKIRRPTTTVGPIKRPASPLAKTPPNAKLARPQQPPPIRKKSAIRELFKSVHPQEPPTKKSSSLLSSSSSTSTTTTALSNRHKLQVSPVKLNIKPLVIDDAPTSTSTSLLEKTPTKTPTIITLEDSPSKIASGPLKGISTSLLDRIRAKEAAAKATTPEEERRRDLLGIAPEVIRIVFTVFTANKKQIMLYDTVVEKCFKGLKSNYTSATIIECLDLMDKVAPEWTSTVKISRGRFMRINRDKYTIPQLLEAIRKFKMKNG